ncbi:MAG: putative ABC transporter family protein, partial [Streblomastix strix]
LNYHFAIQTHGALNGLIFEKSLNLNLNSQAKIDTGKILTLISYDVQAVCSQISTLMTYTRLPISILTPFIFVIFDFGVSSLIAVALIILLMFPLIFFSKKNIGMAPAYLLENDIRMKVTNEVLRNIRVVKFSGLENVFIERIQKTRQSQEIDFPLKMMPDLKFMTLMIKESKQIPSLFSTYRSIKGRLNHFQQFLTLPDFEQKIRSKQFEDENTALQIENGSFSWGDSIEIPLTDAEIEKMQKQQDDLWKKVERKIQKQMELIEKFKIDEQIGQTYQSLRSKLESLIVKKQFQASANTFNISSIHETYLSSTFSDALGQISQLKPFEFISDVIHPKNDDIPSPTISPSITPSDTPPPSPIFSPIVTPIVTQSNSPMSSFMTPVTSPTLSQVNSPEKDQYKTPEKISQDFSAIKTPPNFAVQQFPIQSLYTRATGNLDQSPQFASQSKLRTERDQQQTKDKKKKKKIHLYNINMSITKGSLTMIIGGSGSGKSSLGSAIIGDIEKQSGEVKCNGSIAYCPQTPWINNQTIQDNIIFGNTFDEEKYNEVVHVCALEQDFDILPAGDQTAIGEKGVNLSGGQKARIQLARAVYSDRDIYILDDTLSAVDAHVG